MKSYKYLFLISLSLLLACTDLEEELNQNLTKEEAEKFLDENTDVSALLKSAYESLRNPYQSHERFWALQQHTTDETLGPTRGPDWDDNGIWRVLHAHTWTADHAFIAASFNELLQVVFNTTNVLNFNASTQQQAEARLLRALAMFSVADSWNQVPFRNPGDNLLNPPTVLKGAEAMDFIISEINAIMADLPDGPENKANKDAARALLMKVYLNKGTFADRANPSFPAGDMNEVIAHADAIINSGKYSLSGNYFGNFAPNNDQISTENIWTSENVGGSSAGLVRSRWFSVLHYHQSPSGWNGFATLSEFYDSFESNDIRRGTDYPGMTDVGGVKAGLLVGQQYDKDGNALMDRKGNPLAFTPEVSLVETDNNLEITGIRVIKYPIDYNNGDNTDNDYVLLRYADVLLMKAEALLRTGNSGGALDLVNEIRTARGASSLGSINLDQLLDERSRELYWEGWRRQDLIRFGKFLEPWQEKSASGPERLLFPIPATALSVNPNLEQNPGY